MSYKGSNIQCDWCSGEIGDGGDVACRKCYEELEEKIAELEKEVESLRRAAEEKP